MKPARSVIGKVPRRSGTLISHAQTDVQDNSWDWPSLSTCGMLLSDSPGSCTRRSTPGSSSSSGSFVAELNMKYIALQEPEFADGQIHKFCERPDLQAQSEKACMPIPPTLPPVKLGGKSRSLYRESLQTEQRRALLAEGT